MLMFADKYQPKEWRLLMKKKTSLDPLKANLHHFVAPSKNSNWARLYCPRTQQFGRVGFKDESCTKGLCTLCGEVVLTRE